MDDGMGGGEGGGVCGRLNNGRGIMRPVGFCKEYGLRTSDRSGVK